MPTGSSNTPESVADAVKWHIVSNELIPPRSRVLVAVSGGADSMAMLSILHGLGKIFDFEVAAGHLNHGLRPAAADEANKVKSFAESLRVVCHSDSVDVRALADSTGDTLEEAGRKARYGFLDEVAGSIGADKIATGHTRTDQIETVLMRFLRGAGIRGLAGIPLTRGRLVRPILCLSRDDTVMYCEKTGLPVSDDPSNDDRRFFRNKIRHDLLPLLETEYNPSVGDSILRLAKNARSAVQMIRRETDPLINKNLKFHPPASWLFDTGSIVRLDETSLVILFGDLFAEKLGCDMDFTRAHFESLNRLLKDPQGSGKQISLPGLTVKKEYENLVITRRSVLDKAAEAGVRVENAGEPVELEIPGKTTLPGGIVQNLGIARNRGAVIVIQVLDDAEDRDRGTSGDPATIDNALKATERAACFDFDKISPPLTLRLPVKGDRIQPFGMTGTKKLSDIFGDKKIPARDRTSTLVITDANDIIWLVGVATSEKTRVTPQTRRVVKIRVENP